MLHHQRCRDLLVIQAKLGAVSVAALLAAGVPAEVMAQSGQAQGAQSVTPLPTVSVDITKPRRRPQRAATAPRQRVAAPPQPQPQAAAAPTQASRSGTVGYVTTRTTTGTKTDTPIINIPQSISVVTQEFIRDQNNQAFTETLRYVPGVIPHQGEGNRDDVVIRGQRSNADFFVNGVRDDVQYFRDTYNVQRVEVLKGPNAMIFGRGGGGGVINRVLKEADGARVREVTVGAGQFGLGRVAVDVGDAINPNVAARFNAVYENSDSYRDFGHLERYGFNPTVTFKPTDATTIALSYEYFHDRRVTDRGIPSQARTGVTPGPATPLLPYLTSPSTFFGHPNLNYALVDAHIGTAVIEHDFDNGLKVKNHTRYASYDKFYQNIFPGGAVNPAGTSVALSAYNNETDRQNVFNQTDVTYKVDLGLMRHTLLAGVEVGRQSGLSFRQDGFFNNAANPNGTPATFTVSPLNPTTYVPVVFRNLPTSANNTYQLGLGALYVQDQIEITRYFQLIGGLRFDHFDLSSQDRRTLATFNRVDDLTSPRFGVVLKPFENLSFYGSYAVSYLPSAGDQFSTLNPGTVIAAPEKFENREFGIKWDIVPRLQFTAAVYNLDRYNQRFPDPNNPGFFILSGRTNTKGFETGLVGTITDQWQVSGGYAYTDAKIVGATSGTIVPGNRVGLVPYHTFTLWNKYAFVDWFALGAGIIHQTDSFASSDDTVLLPGFTRVDAGVFGRYRLQDGTLLSWQVNVENVFNTAYYATADGNNNISPGSPRAIRGVIRANF
jgi:catecholate siderophore receptor